MLEQPSTTTDNNEISVKGKWIAGIFLIFFTVVPVILIVAYWPDRIPGPKDGIMPLYNNQAFHVRLACISDTVCLNDTVFLKNSNVDSSNKKVIGDSSKANSTDTAGKSQQPPKEDHPKNSNEIILKQHDYIGKDLVHLNTLIMLLVAAAGFLGNMIHIATSFTTFIGAGQFKKSWILWYCIKPFTAAALALGLYFVFRGGFLNYSADASSINLYGILTISLLAGLFTDRATLKLGEIFEVIFSIKKDSKEQRPDPLEGDDPKITSISLDKLELGKINTIVISGERLDKKTLVLKINNSVISIGDTKSTTLTFDYSIPDSDKDKTEFILIVSDEKGVEYFKSILKPVEAISEKPADVDRKENENAQDEVDSDLDDTDENNPVAKG